ncbi:hypothetical protein KP509_22G053800 [Ceratopteris richardii]|uniref:F-box domain-containing protein n=1 Tax=Ceratopteris richardii TaxID=49495 RepID=A0A8T2S594_CERRI|nr:hypothetical protein KP509_22G053800 [Ceratopteris richardii]
MQEVFHADFDSVIARGIHSIDMEASETRSSEEDEDFEEEEVGDKEEAWDVLFSDTSPSSPAGKGVAECDEDDSIEGEEGDNAEETGNALFSASSPSSSVSEGEEVAECEASSIWGELPSELVDRVLAFLPPICLFRLRAVCTRWRGLPDGDGGFFRALSKQIPPHGPCFLMAQKDGCVWRLVVYSYPMRSWHALPSPSPPEKETAPHSLVASAGGLLCFAVLHGCREELLVSNAFRQTYRRLPPLRHTRQLAFVAMITEENVSGFKIVAAGDGSSARARPVDIDIPTEVYDSKSDAWVSSHSQPPAGLRPQCSAFWRDRLYCLTVSPIRLVAFDLERCIWETLPVRMPRLLQDAHLIAGGGKGRLLLVGRIALYSLHQSMRIWEINAVDMEWTEVGRMPHMLFRALLRSSAESFQCFGYGDFICFAAQKQPQRWLLYDTSHKIWHWFGSCPLLSSSSRKKVRGFYFEPRLWAGLR